MIVRLTLESYILIFMLKSPLNYKFGTYKRDIMQHFLTLEILPKK